MSAVPLSGERVRHGQFWKDGFPDVGMPRTIRVMRVARDGSWADIRVRQGNITWGKRMQLPFPSSWSRLG